MQLSLTALPGIPDVEPGDDLAALIADAVARARQPLEHGDVLVVAQKIVSKAEDRLIDLRSVEPSARALDLAASVGKDPRLMELVLRESTEVVRAKPGIVIVAHRIGVVLANAGIDVSNVAQAEGSERVLLLPIDPDASAARLRADLASRTGVDVGIVISDSVGRAWRKGAVGFAIGAAGLGALVDLRGTRDRYGRPLEHTEVGRADELAAAASILMGQAAEGLPVVLVRGCPPASGEAKATGAAALVRPRDEDLFR